jgi:hypothetical protein
VLYVQNFEDDIKGILKEKAIPSQKMRWQRAICGRTGHDGLFYEVSTAKIGEAKHTQYYPTNFGTVRRLRVD